MQHLLSFLLLAFIAYPFAHLNAQVEHPVSGYGDGYKKFLNLSYAEIDSLVLIPDAKGDYAACIPYMEAGREKAKLEFGEQDSVFAEYTNSLGFYYDYTGQYTKAESLFLQAMAIRKKIWGEQHPNYAVSLNNLAGLYESIGNYTKAEPLY